MRPYSAPTTSSTSAPYNYFQRPDTRYLANVFAHYDVFPQVRVYAEFDFMYDATNRRLRPAARSGQSAVLSNDNPLLSQSFKDAWASRPRHPRPFTSRRRNVEGGGRIQDLTHDELSLRHRREGRLPGRKVGLQRLVAVRQEQLFADVPERLFR